MVRRRRELGGGERVAMRVSPGRRAVVAFSTRAVAARWSRVVVRAVSWEWRRRRV